MYKKWINIFPALATMCGIICAFHLIAHPPELDRAESLFDESLYQDAIPFFVEALKNNIDSDKLQHIQSRLALCHLELKNPNTALAILNDQKEPNRYLQAVAKRQLGLYQEAIDILAEDLSHPPSLLERGMDYYHLGNWALAQRDLDKITIDDPHLYNLSQLYLARIALYQNNPKKASIILDQISISEDSPLQIEKSYLQGVCHFMNHQYEAAIEEFQKLEKDTHKSVRASSQRFLAWSKIQLADRSSKPIAFLDEAEALLLLSENESSGIDLGEFYLMKGRSTKEPFFYEKARTVSRSLPLEQKNFIMGLTFLEEGIYYNCLKQKGEAIAAFEKALLAFRACPQGNHSAKVKLYEAVTNAYLGNNAESVSLLVSLYNDKSAQATLKDPQQIYYLAALLSTDSLSSLQAHVNEGIDRYPEGPYTDLMKLMVGIAFLKESRYDEAYNAFEALIKDHPSSSHLDEAWHWKAYSSSDPERKKEALQYLYIHYPKSPYAPEAYFNTYSYREYLQGSRHSIKHLQALPTLFPQSPLQINAYYLVGLDHNKNRLDAGGNIVRYQNLTAAIEAFQKAEASFDSMSEQNILGSQLPYYRKISHKAKLERGKANLAIGENSQGSKRQIYLKYASDVLEELAKQIAKFSDPFYAQLRDEVDYSHGHALISQGDIDKAADVLAGLIDRSQAASIKQGYLLSRAHYDRGVIAQQRKDYQAALIAFSQAENCAQGLSDDQRLDLWIQQSHCYKGMNRLPEAMSLLSKVINEDVVSGLRIKAMLLRADLYDLQGRPELARKQRDTVAKNCKY